METRPQGEPGKSSLAFSKANVPGTEEGKRLWLLHLNSLMAQIPFSSSWTPTCTHRPSLMLGWLSFWQITAIFMAWYPHIYGIKKKNRRLKYQPFISVTSSHPLSFLSAQPLVRQHLTVACTPRSKELQSVPLESRKPLRWEGRRRGLR